MNSESIRHFSQNQEVRDGLFLQPRNECLMEDHGVGVPLCSATEGTLNPGSLVEEGKTISDNSFTKHPIFKSVALPSFQISLAFAAHSISEIDSATDTSNLGSFPKLIVLFQKWNIQKRMHESWPIQFRLFPQRIDKKQLRFRK